MIQFLVLWDYFLSVVLHLDPLFLRRSIKHIYRQRRSMRQKIEEVISSASDTKGLSFLALFFRHKYWPYMISFFLHEQMNSHGFRSDQTMYLMGENQQQRGQFFHRVMTFLHRFFWKVLYRKANRIGRMV